MERNLLPAASMGSQLISLLVAVATNLWLAGVFLAALTDPAAHTDFIYRLGLMIFVIEFMSLHSSGMFFGASQEEEKTGRKVFSLKLKILLFVLYNIFIVAFASATGQWVAALYFFVSLVSKALFSRSVNAEERMAPVAAGVAMLLLSTFFVVFAASHLADWFPFPASVTAARPPGQSGLFLDTPQTLMAWGVLYFTSMTLCEIGIFRSSLKKASRGNRTRAVAY